MSLYARLMEMTKVEIDDIRRLLNCDVKSGLNKRRMVLGVAEDLCRENAPCPCCSGRKYKDCHGRFS